MLSPFSCISDEQSLSPLAQQAVVFGLIPFRFTENDQLSGLHHRLDAQGQPAVSDTQPLPSQDRTDEPFLPKLLFQKGQLLSDKRIVKVLRYAYQFSIDHGTQRGISR